mmetsp:Transcript_7029/g.14341  ORF Transcript_7029/g.14341 Transcript_7029/m.14341 type:complete len:482 (-) Transcript_7029:84-1529(-)
MVPSNSLRFFQRCFGPIHGFTDCPRDTKRRLTVSERVSIIRTRYYFLSSSFLPLSSPSSVLFLLSCLRALWMAGSSGLTPGRDPSNWLTNCGSWNCFFLSSSSSSLPLSAALPSPEDAAALASPEPASSASDICNASCMAAASSSSSVSMEAAGLESPLPSSAGGFCGSFSFIDMARACCKSASSSLSPRSIPGAAPAEGASSGETASDISASAPSSFVSLDRAAAAMRSCRARSSSMLTRRAIASSGSMLGSTPPKSAKALSAPEEEAPKSPPVAPAAAAAAADAAKAEPPDPPWTIGEEARTSLGRTPGGMVTRWQERSSPSDERPLAASTRSRSFSSFSPSSPIATTSIETLFFLSWRPALARAFGSMPASGDPMNKTMRWEPFLFFRCLRASDATWMAAVTSALFFFVFPGTRPKQAPLRLMWRSWTALRSFPTSSVGLTSSSVPAATPTVDSGWDCVLAPTRRLAASCWASRRVGT